ncbi:hypothetical protein FB451DRAFT_1507245 [Mycena latifolia]|nr:hypothetical protein FB451DRAFT_1507245 [Mycena latifolia]
MHQYRCMSPRLMWRRTRRVVSLLFSWCRALMRSTQARDTDAARTRARHALQEAHVHVMRAGHHDVRGPLLENEDNEHEHGCVRRALEQHVQHVAADTYPHTHTNSAKGGGASVSVPDLRRVYDGVQREERELQRAEDENAEQEQERWTWTRTAKRHTRACPCGAAHSDSGSDSDSFSTSASPSAFLPPLRGGLAPPLPPRLKLVLQRVTLQSSVDGANPPLPRARTRLFTR